MKTRPILFSTSMVRAILDGKKKVTRRVYKPIDKHVEKLLNSDKEFRYEYEGFESEDNHYLEELREGVVWWQENTEHYVNLGKCPYGKEGDILYVRETFALGEEENAIIYKADNPTLNIKWKPSIYMPKTAARINLRITNVTVEQLQQMDSLDAISEGIRTQPPHSQLEAFKKLWGKINGSDSWEQNPWVWVIEFERVV